MLRRSNRTLSAVHTSGVTPFHFQPSLTRYPCQSVLKPCWMRATETASLVRRAGAASGVRHRLEAATSLALGARWTRWRLRSLFENASIECSLHPGSSTALQAALTRHANLFDPPRVSQPNSDTLCCRVHPRHHGLLKRRKTFGDSE